MCQFEVLLNFETKSLVFRLKSFIREIHISEFGLVTV